MAVSQKIQDMQASSSFIRKMFETGARLKAEFGAENVYDYSIGNPSALPPEEFTKILAEEAAREDMHGYMPNAGYPFVRGSGGFLSDRRAESPLSGRAYSYDQRCRRRP